jgi:hypothetical protein
VSKSWIVALVRFGKAAADKQTTEREREREKRERARDRRVSDSSIFGNAELGTDATHYRDAIPWILQSLRFAIFR